jgi:diguanylate cyclase (GGDEF)-like protein
VVIDLDRFKLVNDTYGHTLGDQVLKAVAPRLISVVRESDLVVRLGGDEFGVLVYDRHAAVDLKGLASRLSAACIAPVRFGSMNIHTAASIGIAVATSARDSAESLLRDADAAMYVTKKTNPGGWSVFDDRMRAGMAERLELEHLLSEAIGSDQMSLAFQPVVELARGRICHAEALLRWNSPVRGQVDPDLFIPLAEETGLIFPIGNWVLRTGLAQLARWRAERVVPDGFVLTMNVSARQLRDGFSQEVAVMLADAGVPGKAVGLEITETALISDPATAVKVATELRALGILFLLDDFGTGFSSLLHLQNFPLDVVKLDRTFLTGVDGCRSPVVASVVTLGADLGLAVVAEGIESAEQAKALAELGCGWGQGYFFGRPVPAADFEARLYAEGAALASTRR